MGDLGSIATIGLALAAGYWGAELQQWASRRKRVVHDVLIARKFELINEDDSPKIRGAFGFVDGEPRLVLIDSNGMIRASLTIDEGDAAISLRNGAGETTWSVP